MRLCRVTPAAIAALVLNCITQTTVAAPVDPFTENFTTDSAQWLNGTSTAFATWESAGGPDGSSYASVLMNTQTNSTDSSRILFRGNSTTTPNIHASGDEFAGDWLAGGINHFSTWVYHEAPVALPYFARFATPGGFPGTAALDGTIVQPFTWTKLDYIIDSTQIGITLTPETMPPATDLETFTATFTDVGRVQVGFNVPATMANNATNYRYGLDQVSVYIGAIPEPASCCLVMSCGWLVVIRRRRRAA